MYRAKDVIDFSELRPQSLVPPTAARHDWVRTSVHAGLLVGALGGILWVTGHPFVFPSLGPTAFVLAVHPKQHRARSVIGGHLCGVVAGLLSYGLLADGVILTQLPAVESLLAARLAGSGALSVALTTAGMLQTRTVHAPACATTLIVSLGILPTLGDGAIIMGAVTILYGLHKGWQLLVGWYTDHEGKADAVSL